MADRLSDPIGRLMGLRYKSHPWHGVFIGRNAPKELTAFIEVVSTDTVKYEIDKDSGYLRVDRPQKFSNVIPALYGFIPQTFCGEKVGAFCNKKTGRTDIKGDGDPVDICVLTEKTLAHGDLLVNARPIGGFRMIDGNQADDKIIAVLMNDTVYGHFKELEEVPKIVIQRLEHYFLTYKDMPGQDSNTEIAATYGSSEAYEVIRYSMEDYNVKFDNLGKLLS
ncbi:inorganic pyrophosphatase [Mariniphaga sediminis]|jgi:inorganic pyrophosphatase|uniref:inorganic diphosphatase n=1 Tax=Mariniphaga sediminis TaxID=1628158 RepID=A0A399D4J6_9BACT|nr:inorganic pyrophosphatase [Mariniphaga sediminis]RIH65661.1 inorganic pyrophosphatase [Mariniphaga sediminis]